MSDHPKDAYGQAQPDAATPNRRALLGTGRRRFLLASAPFAVTLASRAALAGGKKGGGGWTQICSPSAMMSVNLSRAADLGPTDDYNCGVSPGCWKNQALYNYNGRTGLWETTDYTTGSGMNNVFGNMNTDYNGTTRRWKLFGTLYDGLNGEGIKYKLPDGTWANMPGGTIANFVAALLNASAWGGSGHYPYLASTVISQIQTLWTQSGFTNQSDAQNAANAIKYQYQYEQYNGGGEDPCGAYL